MFKKENFRCSNQINFPNPKFQTIFFQPKELKENMNKYSVCRAQLLAERANVVQFPVNSLIYKASFALHQVTSLLNFTITHFRWGNYY